MSNKGDLCMINKGIIGLVVLRDFGMKLRYGICPRTALLGIDQFVASAYSTKLLTNFLTSAYPVSTLKCKSRSRTL